jgi:hypothetical protein
LPAIIFGHGNPMNAIISNEYTEAWRVGLETPPKNAIEKADGRVDLYGGVIDRMTGTESTFRQKQREVLHG